MIIDLHTHTFPQSDDSSISPDELIEAAKASDLDGICLTEHDYFWDPDDVRALSRRHNYLVLPGCEINTDSGHVLAFGLEEYVFGMHKVPFLEQLVSKAGGALVAAHPHRRRYLPEHAGKPDYYSYMLDTACADPLFSICAAVEVLNGRATKGETTFSMDLGRRLEMGAVGGSDSHRLTTLGTVATRFHANVATLDDLVRELKAGQFEPVVLERPAAIGANAPPPNP